MKLVSSAEMKTFEQRAEELGVTTSELMLNAGTSVFDAITRLSQFDPDSEDNLLDEGLVLILAGAGNNGGDAMVVADLIQENFPKTQVNIYFYKRPRPETGFPDKLTYTDAEDQEGEDLTDPIAWNAFQADLYEASLLVDGLLGAGVSRQVSGDLARVIDTVNEVRQERLKDVYPLFVAAIDLPSGIHTDTGEVLGVALQSDLTVTLGAPKKGLYYYSTTEYSGQVLLGDIGLPQSLIDELSEDGPSPALVTADDIRNWLPPRPVTGHKGTFGKLMVVSGSDNYLGAPYLSTVAAMRAGAGLVTLASSQNVVNVMASRSSENTFFELKQPDSTEKPDDTEFAKNLESYRALLFGPGLGEKSWKPAFLLSLEVLKKLKLVIDADGLNILSKIPEWWKQVTPNNILTPHPAELARLCKTDTTTIESDRIKSAQDAARLFNQVVVLKGAYTVISSPDGRTRINPACNPALATAGSGDVLAGICAGLLTQAARFDDCDPFRVACCGVYLHSMAGELVRRDYGDMGVLAGDLLLAIPQAITGIKQGDSLE